MTYDAFNAFCRKLPATTYTMQWRGFHVWKVGGKVFAIAGWGENGLSIAVKVSEIAFEVLKDKPGLRPAPYLAPRGMTWQNRRLSGNVSLIRGMRKRSFAEEIAENGRVRRFSF